MIQDAWQIGRLFGIPLRVHVSWLLIFGLVSWSLAVGYFPALVPDLPVWSYWLTAVAAAAMLFVSVILHELGHSLVARRRGIGISSITLFVFGGVSQMKEEPRDPGAELRVALAGPLVSVGLALGFGALTALARQAVGETALVAALGYLAFINLLLAVFNMLPAFPLDGGRVLRAILWRRRGNLVAATRTAATAGRGVAFGLMGLGVLQVLAGYFGGLWLLLIGWFILQAAGAGATQASLRGALGGLRVRDVMATEVERVTPDTPVSELIEQYFARYTYGGYPVVRGEAPAGLVTLHDLRNAPTDKRGDTRVEGIMTPVGEAIVVEPGAPVVDVFNRMVSTGTPRLLVVERGRLVGLITMRGILHLADVRASFRGAD
jgi:Zn-dependent protease/predicted transcriptional regulator